MSGVPKLEIIGLGKTFGSGRSATIALRDINLTLGDNEFVSLVGTSGCGKSTILSIVAGLQDYDDGAVLVDGMPVEGPGLDRGVVFQSYTLLPWLTARQNVEFALKAAGHKRSDCRDLADEHLKLVNLASFAEAYPSQLSGGMKQRVAIARALSYRPKMLLMDEPFGALDALTRHQMQELLTRIWEEHRLTVLFVTHDVEEAVYISDRIVVMGMSPGYIKQSFDVNLPRPRHQRMIGSDAFVAVQRGVMAAIRGESELA
jgi:NitT/TauT family transport system ATP-binding protein